MKAKSLLKLRGILLLLVSSACTQANFNSESGSGVTQAANTAEGEGTVTTGDLDAVDILESGSDRCVEGDVIKLKLPQNVQDCMDQKRIFNFKTNECLTAGQASFACGFDALAKQVAAIGVRNTTVFAAQADGALMVACGEKDAGRTIIAQWYRPPGEFDKCADPNSVSRITTACYKLYTGEVPVIATKEDQERVLLSCLKD
ncbi:MAG: hypothetical protein M3Q07_12755 [Pseudobdellovibrionaceae bacterium]|nr:hypothetical protein [Pseudobdellovibrionaceae bacterium]